MPVQSHVSLSSGRSTRLRRRQIVCGLLLTLLLLPNGLAYFHARAMTTFASGGKRSARPEELSLLGKVGVLLTGISLPRPVNEKTPAEVGLDYETLEIRGDDGIVLEAWRIRRRGSRAFVLMFHGYAASKSSLLPEALAFHELGCETLLVDFRGSGGSSGNESAAVLRAIAVNAVEPAAVIIECPFDRFLKTVENRFSAMGLPAFPLAQMLVFWGGVERGMNSFAHNPVEYAASVRSPALVMHGARDPRVSIAEVESVFANLAGEKLLVLFSEAGHEPYLAVDAPRWQEAVGTFLERIEARAN
jgi:hypothetical protein